MIKKKILNPNRIRHIEGGFGFIPHRFLTDEFLASLTQKEILLYFFLILASDRHGLSFYCYDAICSLLKLSVDEYVAARDGLMKKDGVAIVLPARNACRDGPCQDDAGAYGQYTDECGVIALPIELPRFAPPPGCQQ